MGLTRPEWNPSPTTCSLQDFDQVTLPLSVSVALSVNGKPGTYFTGFFWKPKVNIKRHYTLQSEWSDTYTCLTFLWYFGDEKNAYLFKSITEYLWLQGRSYKLILKELITLERKCITQFSSVHFSSVQFSCSVVSDSLWLHGLQHAKPPCPSPTPGVYSNSC